MKCPIAYVRWFDSSLTVEPSYQESIAPICENESVGFLIRDEEDYISISLDHCAESNYVRCTLSIPRVNIRSIRYIYDTKDNKDQRSIYCCDNKTEEAVVIAKDEGEALSMLTGSGWNFEVIGTAVKESVSDVISRSKIIVVQHPKTDHSSADGFHVP